MGSIAKHPNGQWRARYRDEAGKEFARHFARKVDAQRWLDEVTATVVTGQYVDPGAGNISFAAFYAQWSRRQVWVPSTRVGADHAVKSATFREVPMRALRRSHLEQWVKTMSRSLAASTIETRVNIVRSVLRGAVAERVIGTDPSVGLTLPRKRKREAAMQIPTPEEVGRLLAAADDGLRPLLAVCAFAGLRLGEATGLQVGDVDFLRRQLTVARQLQRDGNGVAVCPPKYGSERTVYLPDEVVAMFADHVARHRANGTDRGRWLFVDVAGLPLHPHGVNYRWRRARKAAGADHVRMHDLRHFYASGLIAAGCDVVTVQRALGHSSATTTLATYAHRWPTAEDRTRVAASGLWTAAVADSVRTTATQ